MPGCETLYYHSESWFEPPKKGISDSGDNLFQNFREQEETPKEIIPSTYYMLLAIVVYVGVRLIFDSTLRG